MILWSPPSELRYLTKPSKGWQNRRLPHKLNTLSVATPEWSEEKLWLYTTQKSARWLWCLLVFLRVAWLQAPREVENCSRVFSILKFIEEGMKQSERPLSIFIICVSYKCDSWWSKYPPPLQNNDKSSLIDLNYVTLVVEDANVIIIFGWVIEAEIRSKFWIWCLVKSYCLMVDVLSGSEAKSSFCCFSLSIPCLGPVCFWQC